MHNNTPIVPYVSLCSGYEGIGLGLHRCIPNLRCIAYCEREAFAISNLVAKMENGLLDAAPVFADVTTFPWEQYAPYMAGGILSFGWPCQPVSMAGKRKATEDERWLFDIIADGISILKPGMLFAENVEGLLSAKMPDGSLVFSHCIERLERLHYKVEAGIFSASEVGAPHQRKRVFILAVSNSLGGAAGLSRSLAWNEGVAGESNHGSGEGGDYVAYDQSEASRRLPERAQSKITQLGLNGQTAWPSRPGEPQHGWEPPRVVGGLAHTGSLGRRGRSDGDERRLRGEIQVEGSCGSGAEEAMGNAAQLFSDGSDNNSRISERSEEISKFGNAGRNELGDSTSERPHRGGEDGLGLQPEMLGEGYEAMGNSIHDAGVDVCGTQCGQAQQSIFSDSSSMGNAHSSRPQERTGQRGAGIQGTHANGGAHAERQTQQPVGDPAYGTKFGVGLSELSGLSHSELAEIREWMVKTDNRTDELRLLGNGVVPATAERAFLTLIEELNK